MDSSRVVTRRHLGYIATSMLQQGRQPAHSDAVTSLSAVVLTRLHMAHCAQQHP